MLASAVGRGSSGFEDEPVLGAVKIVRPVGRCILTAPALRRRWPEVEEPAMRATSDDHRVICTPTPSTILTISSVEQMILRISTS